MREGFAQAGPEDTKPSATEATKSTDAMADAIPSIPIIEATKVLYKTIVVCY